MLADKLDVDLYRAVLEKMELNRGEVSGAIKVRGDRAKYCEYED